MPEEFSEGSAKIVKEENTFFNPAQKLNRDLSAEVIKTYFSGKENIKILTAMSATGLRGIRYLNEIPNSTLFFNDICPKAVEAIQENLKYNGIDTFKIFSEHENIKEYKHRANVTRNDCHVLMNRFHSFFDVIDIDPFGSCAEFVNSAFKAIRHNGLICFTCTDKAALCTNEAKCYMRYSTLIKKIFCKNETPIRALLSYISREFSKYDARILPVLSLSVDFYVRVIVRVYKGQGKSVLKDNSHFYICECMNILELPPGGTNTNCCAHCGKKMKLYGPFWNKELHDSQIIDNIISSVSEASNERMIGILKLMRQELPTMFYYEVPKLASFLKINCCKLSDVMTGLANAGHLVSLTHCDNNAFKTNAPIDVIKSLMVELNSKALVSFSLSKNISVDNIFAQNFYKGKIKSGLKPLSLPKK
ncbi:N2,N2-dimethylguanosine tRNA methyltransferase [Vittaforma corneae ATCC 50505]|uniref:tRNA (guanine(26)-N(2))-dimethyltransferase n=1 Tax=Vittaforma corneae (strain ATCC 50505) TaxID=993615 RepID=L2GR29_VITCO|nr:N2,N2-dimethylguanosine tRNA methyltransferase [Vittaforma corneae ATCC 50505]ELA42777.1 N2,N2-dimethylguanosine tRNA methyltransferase [Vittaforma corneae ATCC 50505]